MMASGGGCYFNTVTSITSLQLSAYCMRQLRRYISFAVRVPMAVDAAKSGRLGSCLSYTDSSNYHQHVSNAKSTAE